MKIPVSPSEHPNQCTVAPDGEGSGLDGKSKAASIRRQRPGSQHGPRQATASGADQTQSQKLATQMQAITIVGQPQKKPPATAGSQVPMP